MELQKSLGVEILSELFRTQWPLARWHKSTGGAMDTQCVGLHLSWKPDLFKVAVIHTAHICADHQPVVSSMGGTLIFPWHNPTVESHMASPKQPPTSHVTLTLALPFLLWSVVHFQADGVFRDHLYVQLYESHCWFNELLSSDELRDNFYVAAPNTSMRSRNQWLWQNLNTYQF